MKPVIKVMDGLNFIIKILLGTFISVALVVMTWQIVARYFFSAPLPWSDELVRYLLVWITFLGAGLAVRYSKLIRLDFVFNLIKLPHLVERGLRGLATLLTIAFCVIILIYSWELLTIVHPQKSSSMKIPMSIPYAAIPIGSLIMLLNVFVVWIEGEKTGTGEEVI
ncbi:TRAP transporter small permease [Oceanobacillus sp. CAU 1775]